MAPVAESGHDSMGSGFRGFLTRLGHTSRRGESSGVEEALRHTFPKLELVIQASGHLDGGDVLTIPEKRVMIVGLSSRTDADGVSALSQAFSATYTVCSVPVPKGLHLKSFMTCVDGSTLVVGNSAEFERVACDLLCNCPLLSSMKILLLPSVRSSNVLQIGNYLLVRSLCDESLGLLRKAFGEERCICAPDMSEFEKADGAFTCGCVLFYSVSTQDSDAQSSLA